MVAMGNGIMKNYCVFAALYFCVSIRLVLATSPLAPVAAFVTPSQSTKIACCHRHRHHPSVAVANAPPLPPPPPSSTTTTVSASSSMTPSSDTIADIEEITTFASNNGIKLNFSVRGPGYRGTATSLPSSPAASAAPTSTSSTSIAKEADDNAPILGYVEGFIRPGGKILHADRMEIFNSKQKMGGTFLGPGLLIAYICFLHGYESGCTTCEFLAIDDAEYQHKRLVKYYGTAGFKPVRYVGENLRDIPDRLVWGGCGTLMTQDINVVLEKWTRIIRRASSASSSE